MWIVIPAIVCLATHEAATDLDHRGASKFGAAHNDGFVKKSACLQVFDQRGERLIGILARLAVHFNVEVVIPRIALGVVYLDHAHASFNQARRSETTSRGATFAVHLDSRLGFLANVEHIRRLGLHAKGCFHRVDSRLQLRIGSSSRVDFMFN